MGEVIQLDDSNEGILECEYCGNQSFFIIIGENNDITYLECSNDLCKQRIDFTTITLTKKEDIR